MPWKGIGTKGDKGDPGTPGASFCDMYFDSIVPVTSGIVFPDVYVGQGSGSKYERMPIAVVASPIANGVYELRGAFPTVLPPGKNPLLRLITIANANAGNAIVAPAWASVAVGESPSAATLNDEGDTTITWASGDADKYKETLIQLDADTVVAGEVCVMRLTFKSASWTLAQVLECRPSVTWR